MTFILRLAITVVAISTVIAAMLYAAHVYEQRQPVTIGLSPGGNLFQFVEEYDELRRSGRLVRIDGICISACTFVVGTIPWARICVTPYAKLAFHSATVGGMLGLPIFSSEGTRLAWHIYPPRIRALLIAKFGWDGNGESAEHAELMYLEGEDLAGLFRACD